MMPQANGKHATSFSIGAATLFPPFWNVNQCDMSGNAQRNNVLAIYRRMIRLSMSIQPMEKRIETVAEIRVQFRKHADDVDEEKVEELLKKANSSLGYLKMITPRSRSSSEKQAGQA